jgi:hypothetical protein
MTEIADPTPIPDTFCQEGRPHRCGGALRSPGIHAAADSRGSSSCKSTTA